MNQLSPSHSAKLNVIERIITVWKFADLHVAIPQFCARGWTRTTDTTSPVVPLYFGLKTLAFTNFATLAVIRLSESSTIAVWRVHIVIANYHSLYTVTIGLNRWVSCGSNGTLTRVLAATAALYYTIVLYSHWLLPATSNIYPNH